MNILNGLVNVNVIRRLSGVCVALAKFEIEMKAAAQRLLLLFQVLKPVQGEALKEGAAPPPEDSDVSRLDDEPPSTDDAMEKADRRS